MRESCFQDGNDYGEEGTYHPDMFPRRPILTITLYAGNEDPFIRFYPKLDEKTSREPTLEDRFDCKVAIIKFLTEIVAACKMIPRIEKLLFPGMLPLVSLPRK
jgi:hypothetical protein